MEQHDYDMVLRCPEGHKVTLQENGAAHCSTCGKVWPNMGELSLDGGFVGGVWTSDGKASFIGDAAEAFSQLLIAQQESRPNKRRKRVKRPRSKQRKKRKRR